MGASGYMLETPSIPGYSSLRTSDSDNASGADNQQERLSGVALERILRDHTPDVHDFWMKIWSRLHGDMQE